MIAKFCAVSEDGEVFRKWEQGDTVYFTNGVLKKIIRPNTREFRDFWEMLCSFSHSTTSSQQVGIDWADEKEIFITFCLIRTLLECHYHLLNSVLITKSMRSFAEQYDYTNELKNLRSEVKKNLVATRIYLGDKAKGLAKDYSLSWKLSPLIDNETNTVLTA